MGPVAAQGQITATHEPLRDRQAVVPLPQYPEFIEEFSLAHGVGGGGGEGGFVDDTILFFPMFRAIIKSELKQHLFLQCKHLLNQFI